MTGVEMRSTMNDGFIQWGMKQDLYELKWLIDQILKDSPTFAGEQEFVIEHEKDVVWKTLKT